MIIAVDFDKICAAHEFPRVGVEIGAAEVLKGLTDKGQLYCLLRETLNWMEQKKQRTLVMASLSQLNFLVMDCRIQ